MSSSTARYNKIKSRANSQGGVLKISGGGGSTTTLRQRTRYTDCVSCPYVGFQLGPKNTNGLTNVNTNAVLNRKTNFRQYGVGINRDLSNNNILAKTSHEANYIITKAQESSNNICKDCSGNLCQGCGYTYNSIGNICTVKCGRFVPTNVKNLNIQSSSDYISRLKKT